MEMKRSTEICFLYFLLYYFTSDTPAVRGPQVARQKVNWGRLQLTVFTGNARIALI